MAAGIIRLHIDVVRAPGGRLAKSGRRSTADVAAAAGMRHREETLTPSRLNGHHPPLAQMGLASADAAA